MCRVKVRVECIEYHTPKMVLFVDYACKRIEDDGTLHISFHPNSEKVIDYMFNRKLTNQNIWFDVLVKPSDNYYEDFAKAMVIRERLVYYALFNYRKINTSPIAEESNRIINLLQK